jgi:Tol biopolymer transport system component
LVWADRSGLVEEIDMIPVGQPTLQLSPDNTRLALEHRVGPEVYISIYDMTRRMLESTLTTKRQEVVGMPVWSKPDGKEIVFSRPHTHHGVVVSKRVDGHASEVELFDVAGSWLYVFSFSNDGKRLAYNLNRPDIETGSVIEVFEFVEHLGEGKRRSIPDLRPHTAEPALSPDGGWITYSSFEGGIGQIYVRRYPSGETRRLSPDGGNGPLWSPDGTEIFYQRRWGAELWMVPIATEPQLKIGEARMLFEGSFLGSNDSGLAYDVSRDGQRFLMVRTNPQDWIVSDLFVVQNWFEELERLVPTGR